MSSFLPGITLTGGVEIDFDAALRLFPGSTFVLGDSQVSLVPVPDEPMTLYVLNTITRPGSRRQGGAKALMDQVYAAADEAGVTLCTHPDEPWMAKHLLDARGYQEAPQRPTWDGKPCLVRYPKTQGDTSCL